MKITIEEIKETNYHKNIKMITELMNYHRKLTKASKKFYQTDEESEATMKDWLKEGHIYNIFLNEEVVGFFYVHFGGQKACWLEDLYVAEGYRGKGIGKIALNKLDELMREIGILAMFVNVIPRNTKAIEFYKKSGFDHLNMIELRKNYDKKLDKSEEIELLGFKFKKY